MTCLLHYPMPSSGVSSSKYLSRRCQNWLSSVYETAKVFFLLLFPLTVASRCCEHQHSDWFNCLSLWPPHVHMCIFSTCLELLKSCEALAEFISFSVLSNSENNWTVISFHSLPWLKWATSCPCRHRSQLCVGLPLGLRVGFCFGWSYFFFEHLLKIRFYKNCHAANIIHILGNVSVRVTPVFCLLFLLGVADGVGGWRDYGVDPSQFSGTLMRTCERLVKEGRFVPSNPVGILTAGYCELLQNKVPLLGKRQKRGLDLCPMLFTHILKYTQIFICI